MKQKSILLFLVCAILSLALVSAANFSVTTSPVLDLSKSKTNSSFLITPNLQTGQLVNILVTLPQQISDSKGNVIALSPPYSFTLNNIANGQTQGPINIFYTAGTIPANFIIGKYTVNAVVNATDTTNSTNTLSQNVPINFISDFCTNGENGTGLSISRVDVRNDNGDDTDWKPLDSITVKVEVSNEGTERVRKTYVELGLIDSLGKNVIKNMEDLTDRKISIGSLSDGKDSTKEFKFKVPFDFKEENYKLVVKAYSDDVGQKALCIAHSSDLDNTYYQSISGQRETDEEKQVIVNDNVLISPEIAQCSDTVQLSGEVANIGDTDYEDKIKVTLYNKELGINTFSEISTDLSQGDTTPFSFDFTIPATVSEKTYNLEMKTYYDYDSDGTYNLISDKIFSKTLKVEGNCKTVTPVTPAITEPSISAQLSSETPQAIAGKEIAIQATIRNNANKEVTYTISVSDNSDWSSLVSVEPRTVTVAGGQSKDVIATLKIDKEASGDKEFTIKATYGDNQVKSYIGQVTIVKPNNPFGSIGTHFQENWYIYLIVLVNLILIIAIIVVIIKMMKPRRA